ncbi:flagellar protein FliS [Austwickia chelonae]|uniref:Flagellar secretion chaperone FliS n=1 Tax=Austwickia chelonae NBRC 105200 TaxID=1184607 RepID=K6UP21_9MICO|nr:flagellar export chaperone FliS [Austwickia chelonae]GAB79461.1 flagellar protein FliS [Austwickia chelonae NBRC 105200]SEV88247.1 flagellar protein FliS [Austwickia chelonae]
MTTAAQLRNRYAQDTVSTASPAKLLVMLYDRLSKDLLNAEQAVVAGDIPGAHAAIVHAQEIITELAVTLDVSAWEGGEKLLAVYEFCLQELFQANVHKDAARVHSVREIIEPLRDSWKQAAAQTGEKP